MNLPTATRLRITDRIRREWYVFKVDFHAQDVPGGYRKGRRRELRSDLTSAAARHTSRMAGISVGRCASPRSIANSDQKSRLTGE